MENQLNNSSLTADNKIPISRKKFRQLVMPHVGDILCQQFRVEYINYAKLRLSASYKINPPKNGDSIKIEDRLFIIDHIDVVKKTFGATFKGFDEPIVPIPDAPEVEPEDGLIKLI